MFDGIHGLSCVENHVLAIMREQGHKIVPLYHDAAVPMRKLFDNLIKCGERQEYFNSIARVQDILKNLGIINFTLNHNPSGENVRSILHRHDCDAYILVRCTPLFAKQSLHARGWRNDHYVRARVVGEGIEIINDIPEKAIVVDSKTFDELYSGSYFEMHVLRELNKQDELMLLKTRSFKPEDYQKSIYLKHDFDGIPNAGLRLRNLAGIHKILRYRLASYYNSYMDARFIFGTLPDVEQYFALFEYFNIKKNVSFEKYFRLFCDMNEAENHVMTKLQERIITHELS